MMELSNDWGKTNDVFGESLSKNKTWNALHIRAIEGDSGARGHPIFFSQQILESGFATELYHIGCSASNDSKDSSTNEGDEDNFDGNVFTQNQPAKENTRDCGRKKEDERPLRQSTSLHEFFFFCVFRCEVWCRAVPGGARLKPQRQATPPPPSGREVCTPTRDTFAPQRIRRALFFSESANQFWSDLMVRLFVSLDCSLWAVFSKEELRLTSNSQCDGQSSPCASNTLESP